jgi:hypothetical protein
MVGPMTEYQLRIMLECVRTLIDPNGESFAIVGTDALVAYWHSLEDAAWPDTEPDPAPARARTRGNGPA